MSKILIVDDEPRILLLLQSLLKANGYDVETARDGDAAIEVVRKGGVDITVTDLRMTPMDGMTLFRELKAISPSMPVILLTAYASVETAIHPLPVQRSAIRPLCGTFFTAHSTSISVSCLGISTSGVTS